MGEPSSKKRKREGEPSSKPKKKKVVLDVPPATASVASVLRPSLCPPLITTTPGIELPKSTRFHCYQSRDEPRSKAGQGDQGNGPELLLRSAAHASVEYTAREAEPRGTKPLLSHYLAVYDPSTGKLDVIEARTMVVRGQVRATAPAEDKQVHKTFKDRRMALGQTFGTKKAKKAIRDMALNAIAPSMGAGGKLSNEAEAAMRATLDAVGKVTSQMATREELQAAAAVAKPVPPANVDATEVEHVYDAEAIIGADVLNLVPVREWQETVRRGESVQTVSRFVAARLNKLATDDSTLTQLRILRYMECLLRVYRVSKPARGGSRQLPPREKLRQALEPAPEAVVENIRRRFSAAGVMGKFHVDLLKTHCCVFSLLIDGFETITQQLREDLGEADDKTMNTYFHEVGARVGKTKAEGRTVQVAKLALPLKFPKQGRGPPRRKR